MAHVHTAAMPSGKRETEVAPGRNERRKARTRSALLAAGQRLFGERGFDATTVAEIAEAADVAIGSFYNYFDTKDELLAALLQRTLAEHLRRMQARRAGIYDPAEAISVALWAAQGCHGLGGQLHWPADHCARSDLPSDPARSDLRQPRACAHRAALTTLPPAGY